MNEWKRDLIARIVGLNDDEQVRWVPKGTQPQDPIEVNHTGSDFEFKAKVSQMTDYYLEVVSGGGSSDEFDKYDAKRKKIESKIVSLKQPKNNNSGFFSEINIKDKKKVDIEEAKLKFVLQMLEDLKANHLDLESVNKGLLN